MRVLLPSLKTVGWFTGSRAEGESKWAHGSVYEPYFGGKGIEGFYKEMTTAHVRLPASMTLKLAAGTDKRLCE